MMCVGAWCDRSGTGAMDKKKARYSPQKVTVFQVNMDGANCMIDIFLAATFTTFWRKPRLSSRLRRAMTDRADTVGIQFMMSRRRGCMKSWV